MAYVVLLHLAYLLTSIPYFKLIQNKYVEAIKERLKDFMAEISAMLVGSSFFLYDLMNTLIEQFCRLINDIFLLIKAKLLFYLGAVYATLLVDYFYLLKDVESFTQKLSELQSDLRKYLSLSKLTNQFLKPLVRLTEDNKKLKELINKVNGTKTIINKLDHKFSYQNVRISKTLKLLSSINLERSIKSTRDKNPELVMNLKINLGKLKKDLSSIINLDSDKSLIVKVHDKIQGKITASIRKIDSNNNGLQKGVESIQKLLDAADQEVSKEIMSIIQQLLIVEKTNLVKLLVLINQIKLLHLIILIRIDLLICTIQFHKEITTETSKLFDLMKFKCCNASEFLSSCSSLEIKCHCLLDKIYECIKNLRESCNKCKGCSGVPLNLIVTIAELMILILVINIDILTHLF